LPDVSWHWCQISCAFSLVLSVGGTTLSALNSQGTHAGEFAWSGSGGGQASFEPEPAYQKAFPIPYDLTGVRGNPDVAYNADPNTGFAVYTTVSYQGFSGWIQVGGTIASAPQWAALIAIAKSMGFSPGVAGTNPAIYEAAAKSKYIFVILLQATESLTPSSIEREINTGVIDGVGWRSWQHSDPKKIR
jgi:subtilase family serine protease